MIKAIKETIQFLYNDVKTDIKAIRTIFKRLKKGEPIIEKEVQDGIVAYYKNFSMSNFLKEYWMGILFCILCGVVGWYLAAVRYESLCNQIIYDNYIVTKPLLDNATGLFYNITRG